MADFGRQVEVVDLDRATEDFFAIQGAAPNDLRSGAQRMQAEWEPFGQAQTQ